VLEKLSRHEQQRQINNFARREQQRRVNARGLENADEL
jgi:hypothetical protein